MDKNDKYKLYLKGLELHWTSQSAMTRNELEHKTLWKYIH